MSKGFTFTHDGYPLLIKAVNKEQKFMIAKIFHSNDAGLKGYLNIDDLKVAVAELIGYKASKREVKEMLRNNGCTNEYEGLNLEQFSKAMEAKLSLIDDDDEIRQMFKMFDMQCKGFLTFEDLKTVFQEIAPNLSAQRIAAAFREIDQNADGRVSYRDFEYVMKYDTEGHG